MKRLLNKVCSLILLWCICGWAWADFVDSFAPRHKLATQLAPALQEAFPDASIKAFSGQIIVSTSDQASYQKIRALADRLDTVTRSLRISVEQREWGQQQRQNVELNGGVVIGQRGSAAQLELDANQSQRERKSVSQQSIRTLEGSQAMIMLGQQRFIPQISFIFRPGYAIVQHGGQWQAAGSGFYVQASLLGEQRFSAKLSPQSSSFNRDGSIDTREAYSEIEGRLGEWLPIGETQAEASNDRRRIAGVDQQNQQSRYTVWLKVDLQ